MVTEDSELYLIFRYSEPVLMSRRECAKPGSSTVKSIKDGKQASQRLVPDRCYSEPWNAESLWPVIRSAQFAFNVQQYVDR